MTRLLGAVFGLAATGALFEALENNRLFGLLTTAGAGLDASDRTEYRVCSRDRRPQRQS